MNNPQGKVRIINEHQNKHTGQGFCKSKSRNDFRNEVITALLKFKQLVSGFFWNLLGFLLQELIWFELLRAVLQSAAPSLCQKVAKTVIANDVAARQFHRAY